jgi:hypothetical protein
MGDVIPFPNVGAVERGPILDGPTRPHSRPAVEVELLGPMHECTDRVHVFVEVPGKCQCGEREWDDLSRPDQDVIGLHAVE